MLLDNDKIIDPTYKILNFIQSKNRELFDNDGYVILFGNLKTNFLKLFNSVVYVYDIQKDSDFMKRYNQKSFVSSMLIEYSYVKLSTVWDISYQIGAKLTKLTNSKGNRYEQLEKEFLDYAEENSDLNLDWYKEVNKIIPFYLDDNGEIKNRLCFQVYDFNLEDLIPISNFYTNKSNNYINFVDNYFAFYTSTLYSYLVDFFNFILLKICNESCFNLNSFDKHENLDTLERIGIDDKHWSIANMKAFKCIASDMLKLYKNEGNYIGIDRIVINQLELEKFFPMLGNSK
ncbi:TPA: hypothetical protein WID96_000267 [Neisseria meningitidis]